MSKPNPSTKRKKLTPKQRVMRKYPKADCWKARDTGRWIVTKGAPLHQRLGVAVCARVAWKLADMRIHL